MHFNIVICPAVGYPCLSLFVPLDKWAGTFWVLFGKGTQQIYKFINSIRITMEMPDKTNAHLLCTYILVGHLDILHISCEPFSISYLRRNMPCFKKLGRSIVMAKSWLLLNMLPQWQCKILRIDKLSKKK